MVVDKELVRTITVYGSAVVDQTTQQGIVTAVTSAHISNIVFLGITLGGWATILIFIGTLLLFIMNVSKFVSWARHQYKSFKRWREKRKYERQE